MPIHAEALKVESGPVTAFQSSEAQIQCTKCAPLSEMEAEISGKFWSTALITCLQLTFSFGDLCLAGSSL